MAEAVKVVIADIKTTASELLTTVTGKCFAAPVWFRNFIFDILVVSILRHFRSILRLPISHTTVICPLKSYCCSQSEYTLGKWLLKLILKKNISMRPSSLRFLRFFCTKQWITLIYGYHFFTSQNWFLTYKDLRYFEKLYFKLWLSSDLQFSPICCYYSLQQMIALFIVLLCF